MVMDMLQNYTSGAIGDVYYLQNNMKHYYEKDNIKPWQSTIISKKLVQPKRQKSPTELLLCNPVPLTVTPSAIFDSNYLWNRYMNYVFYYVLWELCDKILTEKQTPEDVLV